MDAYNFHLPRVEPKVVDPDLLNAKRITQQLVLLAHAEICRRKRGTYQNMKCTMPYCDLLLEVLTHLNSCRDGESCVTPHCFSSRNIIMHYQRCKSRSSYCPVCECLKIRQNSTTSAVVPQDLFEPYYSGL